MNYWKQVPTRTRISLGLIACLIMFLSLLIIIRAADWPIGVRLARAILNPSTEGSQTTLTPQATGTAPAAPALPPGAPWLRTITQASVWTGPGMTFDAIATIESGQILAVLGTDPNRQWWLVQAPALPGGKGWVAAGEVIVENAANAPIESGALSPSVPTDLLPVVQAVTIVNIRSGPDLRFQKIGSLELDQTAEIVGKSEDGLWYAIRLPEAKEKTGWVARDYVVTRNADDIPVVTEAPANIGGGATIAPGKPFLSAAWDVNIRAGPGTEYAVIGTLKQGASAEIVGKSESGLWWAIQFFGSQNERGWVASEFVQTSNSENAPILK